MPEISRFFGIIITINYNDHNPPHFHFRSRITMLKDIIAVHPLPNYQLYLRFEDNQEGIINIQQQIEFKGVFSPLSDPDYFVQVAVNPELGTIQWPNGADLDPDVLYSLITQQTITLTAPVSQP